MDLSTVTHLQEVPPTNVTDMSLIPSFTFVIAPPPYFINSFTPALLNHSLNLSPLTLFDMYCTVTCLVQACLYLFRKSVDSSCVTKLLFDTQDDHHQLP